MPARPAVAPSVVMASVMPAVVAVKTWAMMPDEMATVYCYTYIRLFVSWTVENRRTDRNTIYKSPTIFHHIHVKPTA